MIIHIDMDSFYASVEIRENPDLAGLPVVVGGSASGRGVVATANYEARKYGVLSAMPMAHALRLCPDLVCLPVNMPLYVNVSKQIRDIFYRYTPEIEPLSLDEAFLDVAGSEKLLGSAAAIARKIKQDIKNECNLIASAGVAPNKFVAKIASDIDKPDGYVLVAQNEVQDFLDPLPVNRIWGVGKKTEQQLRQIGIKTIQDARYWPADDMIKRFGKMGDHIQRLAQGLDKRAVISDAKAKSISAETTFANDIEDKDALLAILLQLTEQVAARLRDKDIKGRTVNIKIRFHDFNTITRSKTLPENTNQTRKMWNTVKQLFLGVWQQDVRPIRLVGVGISNFSENMELQRDLFTDSPEQAFEQNVRQEKLDALGDEINEKFGKSKLRRGRNLEH
ncbi:MAG: DNA polymerase IV [Gammaproteobacteria bacterium]|nr:DNA polymerase IV [Gammaproteobacteria bacterium]